MITHKRILIVSIIVVVSVPAGIFIGNKYLKTLLQSDPLPAIRLAEVQQQYPSSENDWAVRYSK